jgi:hypothetical protein
MDILNQENCQEDFNVSVDALVIPQADLIADKLERYLRSRQHDFVLSRFFIGAWECDVFSVSQSGFTNEYEIKRTLSDYKNDFKKSDKWNAELKKHEQIEQGKRTNKFWYVIPEDWTIEIPKHFGIYTYRYQNGEVIFVTKKREAKILNRTKYREDLQMLNNLASKCYYRFLSARRAGLSV